MLLRTDFPIVSIFGILYFGFSFKGLIFGDVGMFLWFLSSSFEIPAPLH